MVFFSNVLQKTDVDFRRTAVHLPPYRTNRYKGAPPFRRLALLDGIRSILVAHGVPPSLRMGGIDACLPMLLHGVDSTDAGVVQAATDIMLVSTMARETLDATDSSSRLWPLMRPPRFYYWST